MSNIRVVCNSEQGTSYKPAEVLVYDGEVLIARVIASLEPKQGADGGYYLCVELRETSCEEHSND
jgi:hypothetical protein